MAAPGIVVGELHHPSSHRIEMDVPQQGDEVLIRGDD
jgi:hypothetical protein